MLGEEKVSQGARNPYAADCSGGTIATVEKEDAWMQLAMLHRGTPPAGGRILTTTYSMDRVDFVAQVMLSLVCAPPQNVAFC